MAIKRPDEYEHSNPDLSVVDSDNVRGAVKIVANQSAMLAIPLDKLKEGSIVKYKELGEYLSWELQDISDISDISSWKQLDDANDKVDSNDYEEALNIDVGSWKDTLGISNIDNTPDLDKPISTATKTSLNLKANKSNIFASTATSENIPSISAFIKDITVVSGLDSTERFYLNEFIVSGSGYKVVIRDQDVTAVFNSTFTYTAPTTNPNQLNDVVEWTNNGVTIRFTLDWTKFTPVIWSTTSLELTELNNAVIFGDKIEDVVQSVSDEATTRASEDVRILAEAKLDATLKIENQTIGLENRAKNIVANPTLLTDDNWTTVGATLTDGVFYFSKQNYYASQIISLDEQPIGTNLVFAAKMKSIGEPDFLFKITLVNDGSPVSGGTFFIEKDTDDSFLLDDGYYQILKKFTTTTLVDQINVEIKANINGSDTYNSGEGVYGYNPYVAIYDDGDEFFFTENNYFPSNYIKDYSRFSDTTNSLSDEAKSTFKEDIFNDLKEYDTSLVVNMLGDSYTELGFDENRGFIWFAAQYLGLDIDTNFNKYGIGGTIMANDPSHGDNARAMVNRYTDMPKCDALGILGFFNDNITPFSTWTEKLGSVSTKTDINTIWGAYATIIEGHLAQYPYANPTIFLMTYPYDKGQINKVEGNQVVRDIADYYNLPLLDFEKLAGIKDGLNANLSRTSIVSSATWVDERRISYADGKTIWNITDNPTSSADIYSYTDEFIPVDTSLYRYINRSTQSNILQYEHNGGSTGTDADYDFIGNDLNSTVYETKLEENCTHIRISCRITAKSYKYSIVDGEFVTDETHINMLGMRDKMSPIFTEFLKQILKRK